MEEKLTNLKISKSISKIAHFPTDYLIPSKHPTLLTISSQGHFFFTKFKSIPLLTKSSKILTKSFSKSKRKKIIFFKGEYLDSAFLNGNFYTYARYDGIYLSNREPVKIFDHHDCGNIGATIRVNKYKNHLLLNKKYDFVVIVKLDKNGFFLKKMEIDFKTNFKDKIIDHQCLGELRFIVVLKGGLLVVIEYNIENSEFEILQKLQILIEGDEMPNTVIVDNKGEFVVVHTRIGSFAESIFVFGFDQNLGKIQILDEICVREDGLYALYSLTFFCRKAGVLFFCGLSYSKTKLLTFGLDLKTKRIFELRDKRVEVECQRPLKIQVYKNSIYSTDKENNFLKFKYDFTKI